MTEIITPSCQACHSFKTTGFSLVPPEVLKNITNLKITRTFKKGDALFEQGGTAPGVYCLREGLIKLEMVGADGGAVTVGFAKKGDLLGVGAVISSAPATYTAYAAEDTTACVFSAELFKAALKHSPEFAFKMLSQVFTDLRQTQARLLSGVEKDVHARVAESVIYLKANYEDHRFTRKEIAEWAGTTTESVIRTLADFEAQGLIEQNGREIVITNRTGLEDVAGILV